MQWNTSTDQITYMSNLSTFAKKICFQETCEEKQPNQRNNKVGKIKKEIHIQQKEIVVEFQKKVTTVYYNLYKFSTGSCCNTPFSCSSAFLGLAF